MSRDHLDASLEGIRHLLSHLHGEITALESSYDQMVSVLRRVDGACSVEDLDGMLRRKAFFERWNAVLAACAPFIDTRDFATSPVHSVEAFDRIEALLRAA